MSSPPKLRNKSPSKEIPQQPDNTSTSHQKRQQIMADQVQELINSLLKTQFSALKGSSGDFEIQVNESLVAELISLGLESQRKTVPWLALVDSIAVRAPIRVHLKLKVPAA